jgi:four helix bundle protein
LTVGIYHATQLFPREKIYGVTSQLRRACCSVPANIVEGWVRDGEKDYLHFLYILRASLSETQYFIHLSRRLGYLSGLDAERLIGQTRQTFACLRGLIKAVERETGKFDKMAVPSSRGQ